MKDVIEASREVLASGDVLDAELRNTELEL